MNNLIYSPSLKIPLFKLVSDQEGHRYVEYLNNRTHRSEQIRVSRLIVHLMEAEALSNNFTMIHSLVEKIPLGIMIFDQTGSYLEVKYKQKRERIRLSKYVSLMFENEAQKAS